MAHEEALRQIAVDYLMDLAKLEEKYEKEFKDKTGNELNWEELFDLLDNIENDSE